MNSIFVQNLIISTIGPILPVLLGWGFMRSMHPGRPLMPFQRRLLKYGFIFGLAMCYTMTAWAYLHWPHWSGFTLIGVWGVLIFYIAWRRSHRNQPGAPGVPRPKIPYGRAGVPTAALLVCLVGAFVEWGVVAGGTGHAWVALLWTAGAAASVWLAQRYRRTVVITALRAFVALAVIGAIAERTLAPVVVAAAAAVLLVVLQKLWNPPAPPIEDFDELIHNTGRGSK